MDDMCVPKLENISKKENMPHISDPKVGKMIFPCDV